MDHVMTDLHRGWTILEAATVLARGTNNEGRGYLLTLSNASGSLQHQYYVPQTSEVERLLAGESLPVSA
jgi:hypothetical protein